MSKSWGKGSTTRWRRFRAAILARDNYLCTIRGPACTTHAPLQGGHVDHIQPLHLGGAKYDPANARAACEPCNKSRSYTPTAQPKPKPVSIWEEETNAEHSR